MSLSTSLEIGKRALVAQTYGLTVTSNNISNVGTAGYSRQTTKTSETSALKTSSGYIGTGVSVDGLQGYRQEYLDKEVRNATSKQSGYQFDEATLTSIQAYIAEPSDEGITEQLTNFFDAADDLATEPESDSQKENFISVTKSLVDRLHDISTSLTDARKDVNNTINTDVTTMNGLISDIASLNKDIANSKTSTGTEASTLTDEREVKLEALSKYAGLTVSTQDNGAVNVSINGMNVITGETANTIATIETTDSTTGEVTLSLNCVDSKKNVVGTINPDSGELTSALKHYNITLDDKDTSSGYSLPVKLNEIVNTLATKINNIMSTGYSSSGSTTGTAYFVNGSSGSTTFTASNIQINSAIQSDPTLIPTSSVANESGNNDVITQVANIRNDGTFLNNSTPTEAYAAIATKLGTIAKESTNGQKASALVTEQITTQRDNVTSVDSNEEAVNLIKYQNAFQAAAKIITTVNELLSTLINMGT